MKLTRGRMVNARDWARNKERDLVAQVEIAERMLRMVRSELAEHREKSDRDHYFEWGNYSQAEIAAHFPDWWLKKTSKTA